MGYVSLISHRRSAGASISTSCGFARENGFERNGTGFSKGRPGRNRCSPRGGVPRRAQSSDGGVLGTSRSEVGGGTLLLRALSRPRAEEVQAGHRFLPQGHRDAVLRWCALREPV